MIVYTPEEKITLSLKEKPLSKETCTKNVSNVSIYGELAATPLVSVIVVAYNEREDLIRSLEHWQVQRQSNFELILVDNGLEADIVEKIKKFNVLHIRLRENFGCCNGRNIGAVYANSPILVFGDADGYSPRNYIEHALQIMNYENIIAVRGKVKPIDTALLKKFMPEHYDLGEKTCASLIDTEGNSVWRKNAYISTGGFEDSLAGGEGLVLQYRMIEFFGFDRGAFVYDPSLILYHDYYRDVKKFTYKMRQNAIVRVQLMNKYPFLGQLIAYYSEIKNAQTKMHVRTPSPDFEKKIRTIQENINHMYTTHQSKQIANRSADMKLCNTSVDISFSIVIPCFNLGSLLTTAIDSVLAQTLENIEIIVVDDASTDEDTRSVLKDLESKVHVIYLENNDGVSVARNTGIEKARGDYILCLDADDTIDPTYLEKAKNIFDADSDVGIVSCGVQTFGAESIRYITEDKISLADALANAPVHTASCFRKADWSAGAIYDPQLRGYEDWDHWLRIMELGRTVRVIPEYLFNYFIRKGSKVETSNKNSFDLVSQIIENHKDLYVANYAYIIAKKHEELALMVNVSRDKPVDTPTRDIIGKVLQLKKKLFPGKWLS